MKPRPLVVLCLADKAPLPDYTGSRRRIARTVAALAQRFEVVLAHLGPPAESLDTLGIVASHTVPRAVNRHRTSARLLRRALDRSMPLAMLGADLAPTQQRIADLIAEVRPDIIWASGPWVAGLLPEGSGPVVIDLPHSEKSTIDRALRSLRRDLLSHPTKILELVRLVLDRTPRLRRESMGVRLGCLVTPCSADDMRGVGAGQCEVLLVPNGVDSRAVGYTRCAREPRLLLVGDLHYRPNAEAAELLVFEIAPRIRQVLPDAVVDLVGPCPESVRKRLSSTLCRVHGRVDDVSPFYASASVCLAPIVSGSGTRTKVLEACAFEVPVVTTPLGVEGLDLRHEADLLVGATMTELADHALRLLADELGATRLGLAGARAVRERYSWQAALTPLVEAMPTLVGVDRA